MRSLQSAFLEILLLLSIISRSYIEAFGVPLTRQKCLAVGGGRISSIARFATLNRQQHKRGARAYNKNAMVMMPQGTPMVPWKPPGADYAQFIDIYSRLYRDRILFLGNFIDEDAANNIIAILLYLRQEKPNEKITLYFNIPGALLRPALAVYDIIQQCTESCEVSTLNLGMATGMGAFLCGAGTKGNRSAMPNSRFLLQRTGMDRPFQGQASDIGLEVQNLKKANDRMEKELAKMTGQALSKVRQDLKRDFYLSAEEAVAYGLIDNVLIPDKTKILKEIQWETYKGKRVYVPEKEVDLGNFEGEDVQRYQDQKGGGWGTGWKEGRKGFLGDNDKRSGGGGGGNGDDDDYEPPLQK